MTQSLLKSQTHNEKLARIFFVMAVCWTLVIAGLFLREVRQVRLAILETTRLGGRFVYQKSLVLTDPAIMTRQAHETVRDASGALGHITSLKASRPENAPDPWEADSLRRFESGAKEITSLEMIGNEPYLRLMKPLITEARCLACHAQQGYKVGDIRGGISVQLPWKPYEAIIRTQSRNVFWVFAGIWLLGIVGLGWAQNLMQRILSAKSRATEELAKAYGELKDMHAQIIQSEKMSAMGQLAGGIAHDFNNLLTVINGYSEIQINKPAPGDAATRANLEEILKAGRRAEWLVKQLLAFSRKQVFRLKVINLNDLIRDMDKMLRRLIPESIEFAFLLSPDVRAVKVDPDSFHQVITNLVVNASHAMPNGGKIMIETKNVVLDSNYARKYPELTPGEYLSLSVSDTGTGMSEEVKAHLFEPFFTTKEKGKGTGLGLSTVYGIVKQAGGYTHVYSELGHGTTLTIYVPQVETQAQTWYDADDSKPLPRGTETILLVEDDEAVKNFGRDVLCELGYRVLEASSGVEALHLADEHHGKQIHALFTDMVMPGIGGKELADKFSLLFPGIRILLTSGYTENISIHSGNLKQKEAFLQKPYSRRALAYKIREVLDR